MGSLCRRDSRRRHSFAILAAVGHFEIWRSKKEDFALDIFEKTFGVVSSCHVVQRFASTKARFELCCCPHSIQRILLLSAIESRWHQRYQNMAHRATKIRADS